MAIFLDIFFTGINRIFHNIVILISLFFCVFLSTFTARKRSLSQGNDFTPVSDSFGSLGGV